MSYETIQAPEIGYRHPAETDKQVCSRCLYDEHTPAILFDDDGVCNYCHLYDKLDQMYPTGAEGEEYLRRLAEQIKRENRGKKYDVVVGVSGGCDSSFLI